MRKPRKNVSLFASAILLLGMAACADSATNSASASTKKTSSPDKFQVMNSDVEIQASASETQSRRLQVSGETNLPTGTGFLISLTNEASGFHAQDKTTVANGKFTSVPMGPTAGLPDGKYSIEILMPLPFTQTEQVQEIIGTKGEHLTGPLVEASEYGGNVVSFRKTISLGSAGSIEQAAKQHDKLVKEVNEEANRLVLEGRRMQNLRQSEELSLMRQCGERMRLHQDSAKALNKKSEALPSKYIRLKAATIELSMCVSCSHSAMKACERAATYIAEQNRPGH